MLEKLIGFFLVSAVLGVAVSYDKLYLFHISLVILISYCFIKKEYRNQFLIKFFDSTKLQYMFYGFFFWYLISYFWIDNQGYNYYYKYLFYTLNGVIISLVIVYFSSSFVKLHKVFKILSIIFIIEIILSLLEISPQFQLPISPSSPLVEYFGRSMASNNPTIPTGFNWNQNNLGAVCVLLLPFSLFLSNRLLKLLFTLMIIIVILNTGSFGNFLAMFFVLFVYIFIYEKNFILGSTFLILFISFNFYNDFLPIKIQNKIDKIDEYTTNFLFSTLDNDNQKMTSAKSKRLGFSAINEALINEKKLLIGLGAGQSEFVIKKSSYYHGITSVHNFWYEQLGNGGVIFFTIFFAWYIYLITKLFLISVKSINFIIRYYAKALSLSLMGLFLAAFVPSSMIYMFPLWILFGFSVALINLVDKEKNFVR